MQKSSKKFQWHKSLKWSKNLLILPHQMGPRSILPSVLLVSENYQWLWETVFGQVETDFMAHNSCQQKKEVWAVLIELLTLELTITLLVEWHERVGWFLSFVQICYWISYISSLSWRKLANLLQSSESYVAMRGTMQETKKRSSPFKVKRGAFRQN